MGEIAMPAAAARPRRPGSRRAALLILALGALLLATADLLSDFEVAGARETLLALGGGFGLAAAGLLAFGRSAPAVDADRLRDFADLSSDWLWETDCEHRLTYLSRRFADFGGFEPGEMLGRCAFEYQRPEDDAEAWRRHREDVAARRPFDDFRFWRADRQGRLRLLSVRGRPVYDAAGRFAGYRGATSDVTARAEAESRLARALDASVEGCAVLDADLRFVFMNPQYRRIAAGIEDILRLGASIRDTMSESVRRGHFPAAIGNEEEFVESRIAQLRTGGPPITVRRLDRWLRIYNEPLPDGGAFTVLRDVTTEIEAQRALQMSEARFRAFATAASDWFWETDAEHRTTYVSDQYEARTGTRPAERIGRSAFELQTPEDDAEAWRRHCEDIAARRPFRDFRYMRRAGGLGLRIVSASGAPYYDAEGRFLGYRGSASDVTEQVEAERRARTAEATLAQSLEVAKDGYALLDPELRFVFLNREFRRINEDLADVVLVGAPIVDAIRAAIARGFFPEALGREDEFVAERLRRLREGGPPLTLRRRDGWVRIHNEPLPAGGALTIVRDVTEEVQSRQALEASEARFRAFATASSDWLWETDAEHRLTYVSASVSAATGLDAAEMLGVRPFDSRLPQDDADTWRRHQEDVAARRPFRDFHRLRELGGVIRRLSVSGAPHFDADGRFIGYRGVTSDITERFEAERRARAAEATLVEALQVSADGYALFDAELRFVFVNSEFRRMNADVGEFVRVGGSFADMLREVARRGFVPDWTGREEAYVAERMRRLREGGPPTTLRRRDRWVRVAYQPLPGGSALAVVRDVTEEVEARRALEASEARFRTFATASSDWLWETDAEHRLTFVSSGMFENSPFDPRQMLGRSPFEIQHPNDDAEAWRRHRDDIAARRPFRDFRCVRDLGTGRRHLTVSGAPHFDADGQFLGYRGVSTDITERFEAERRARAAEATLAQALQGSSDGYALLDPALRFVFVNDEFKRITANLGELVRIGASFPEVLQESVRRGSFPDAVGREEEFIAERARRLREGGPPIVLRRGERWLRYQSEVLPDGGALLVVRDVTEDRLREEQLRELQRLDAVGQLSGGIAHDFNNLLAVVMGNAGLAAEHATEGTASTAIDNVLKAARRGAELTRRLLAFSRRQALVPKPADLNVLVAEGAALLSRTLPEAIRVELDLAAGLWTIRVDHGQLHNALLNLAVNARDAMPRGGALRISTANVRLDADASDDGAPAGDYVRLEVADEGVGMTEEVAARVFEPFFTTKEVGQGSGLGLSMVYGLVKQSDGYIRLRTAPGQGAAFEMLFPRIEAPAEPEAREPAATPAPPGRPLVLLIEDQEEVREIIEGMLTSLGYAVIAAPDGPSGLAALAREPAVRLLLCDVMLPGGMAGDEVAERARALRPGLKTLLMSGYPNRPARGGEPVDQPLVQKPFSKGELSRRIAAALAD